MGSIPAKWAGASKSKCTRAGRCLAKVTDTGVGLKALGHGLGTGLASLRERLQLSFPEDAQFELREVEPHGVCAEVSFPARTAR